jgi:hypothetical protein
MSIEILHTRTDRAPKGERLAAAERRHPTAFDHVLDFPLILRSVDGVERKCEAPRLSAD